MSGRSRHRLVVGAIVAGAVALSAAGPVTWAVLLSSPHRPTAARAASGAPRAHQVQTRSTSAHATASSPSDWTVYHGEPDGAGSSPSTTSFRAARLAWRSRPLGAAVYGEPLEAAGRVFVATEADTVYALAARSGRVVWKSHLGTPVGASGLPCGNITPMVGITGTPVLDLARSEIFVVADELGPSGPSHHLVGLDMYTGRVLLNRNVDPPGADPAALLQRTGLALDGRAVVFGFGGNDGDCGPYHGWVESVPVAGTGPIRRYKVDRGPGEHQGAVWMGGAAPEVTSSGDIWVAVGNGSVTAPTAPYDGSDAVIELSPALRRLQLFAPRSWAHDNAADRDLGSTAPALLSNGGILQVGKSHTAFLLRRAKLGGIGGQVARAPACGTSDAGGGDAVTGDVVFVPCHSGLEAISTGSRSLSARWTAPGAQGARAPGGPPIIAGGLVWSVGGTRLVGLDEATGHQVEELPIGSNANDFPTPSVGDGLLLCTGGAHGNAVVAFSGTGGLPSAPTPAP